MRKYGKLLLVLSILAANSAWVSADGLLGGFRSGSQMSRNAQKEANLRKAHEVGYALKQAKINGYDLQVEVLGDAVKLDGKVRDVNERVHAERVARQVPGIKRVQNNLRFVPGGAIRQTSGQYVDSAVRPAYHMTDNQSQNVQQVRFQKPGKRATTARNQQAQRVGQPVPPPSGPVAQTPAPQKLTPPPIVLTPPPIEVATPAIDVATPEVKIPEPSKPNNQAVAQQIANSLAQVGLVGYDVEIRYDNGIATLAGDVASVNQRQAAQHAASQIPNVSEVNNLLQVKGPIAQSPAGQQPIIRPAAMTSRPPAMMAPGMSGTMMPPGMGMGAPTSIGGAGTFSNPQLPSHAWPANAQYPNSAAIQYPTQYSASAFPYIGPFYPYPQVPLGWREVALEWDDGHWQLNFEKKKKAWYWLWAPKNWH